MSIYKRKKGKETIWYFNFYHNKMRYRKGGFKTKQNASREEVKLRELLQNPEKVHAIRKALSQINMVFVDLCERRLNHVEQYNTPKYFKDNLYVFRKLIPRWGHLNCSLITAEMVDEYIIELAKKSRNAANYVLRILRAAFRFGIQMKWIKCDPTADIRFLPVAKKLRYIPPTQDVTKVIGSAKPEEQDYLIAIKETLGRMGEINNLKWDDVFLEERYVVLYTRKKKNGDLTARKIPMTDRLYETLLRLLKGRDPEVPYVFVNPTTHTKYTDRKRLMKKLCKNAKVKYFRYHALRHYGASLLSHKNAPKTDIQRLLGHEKATTTDIYLQSLDGSLRNTIQLMEEIPVVQQGCSYTSKSDHQSDHQNVKGSSAV